VELDPENAKFHFNLAVALNQSGRSDEAIASYRKALEIKPDLAAARTGLDKALEARNKRAGKTVGRQIFAEMPQSVAGRCRRGAGQFFIIRIVGGDSYSEN
jgi:tetratricopeptide (TPR) repeat protein